MYSLTFAPPSSSGGCQVTVTEVQVMLENSIGPTGGDGATIDKKKYKINLKDIHVKLQVSWATIIQMLK
jgi:hypothetical protein